MLNTRSQRQRAQYALWERLATHTHRKLVDYLADPAHGGNTPSAAHREALMWLVGNFAKQALGVEEGRFVYPLGTGLGKTSAVLCFLASLHELGIPSGVVVAASRIEQLIQMKRDLITLCPSIAPHVGVWHSYAFDPAKLDEEGRVLPSATDDHASEPTTTDPQGHRYLFVSHTRVRGKNPNTGKPYVETLNRYRTSSVGGSEKRALCLWDESLITTESRHVSRLDLAVDIGSLGPRAERENGVWTEVVSYLREALRVLDADLERQRMKGAEPALIHLPALTDEQARRFRKVLKTTKTVFGTPPVLIEMAQHPLRVVPTNQAGGAMVRYEVSVDESLPNIAVLDASWPIRLLVKRDKGLTLAPTENADYRQRGSELDMFTGCPADVKDHSTVLVHVSDFTKGSGRGYVERSFSQESREARRLSREVIAVVKSIPEDEAVLVVTYKKHSDRLDVAGVLKRDLEAAGVDLRAKVTTDASGAASASLRDPRSVGRSAGESHLGETKPRINWITWGQETYLNHLAFCQNVILAGVLYRSDADVAGAITGRERDLLTPQTDSATVRETILSEAIHSIYQALSRGSCRIVRDGKALPMNAWVLFSKANTKTLKAELSKVMPGVAFTRWKSVDPSEEKIEQAFDRLEAFLEPLYHLRQPVSLSQLRQVVSDLPSTTFQNARKLIPERLPWILPEKSRALVPLF